MVEKMKSLLFQIFATTAILFCVQNVVTQAAQVIACEHASAKTVSCPSGHSINVIYAFYGRKKAFRCGHNSNTNCLAASSPGIIKNNCQGKNSCILKPSNSVFGDPCPYVGKYLEMKYECLQNVVFQPAQVIACEHASAKLLSCPAGYYINVINAFYGRQRADRCGYNSNTKCLAASSPGIIKNNCQGKNSCILRPSNSVFGDPCPYVGKYLEMKYECRFRERSLTVCEGHKVDIACPPNKIMIITEGFYGRDSRYTCPGTIRTTHCKAASSLDKIKASCNFKRSCKLEANNGIFGDPCRGTRKFIKVKYVCF